MSRLSPGGAEVSSEVVDPENLSPRESMVGSHPGTPVGSHHTTPRNSLHATHRLGSPGTRSSTPLPAKSGTPTPRPSPLTPVGVGFHRDDSVELHVNTDEEDALLASDFSDTDSQYGADSSAVMTASSLHDSITERLEQLALPSSGQSSQTKPSED